MKEEIIKKGSDWASTKLNDFINSITNENYEFKGDYKITWDIVKDAEDQRGVEK